MTRRLPEQLSQYKEELCGYAAWTIVSRLLLESLLYHTEEGSVFWGKATRVWKQAERSNPSN
jgi:hypothetical protein